MVMHLSGVFSSGSRATLYPIAADYQLQELEKNCTNSHNFGVVSLAQHLTPWKFYVTPMVLHLQMFTAREQGSHLIISYPEGASLPLLLLTACWNEVVIT